MAAGISILAAVFRIVLPESEVFVAAKRHAEANGVVNEGQKTKVFLKETKEMLRAHWLLCIYVVLLMTGLNLLAHGSQDLYPTYLQKSKNFSPHSASVATIIGNCGAIAGGAIAGLLSQYVGRRLTIVAFVLLAAVFIPLWIVPTSFSALSAGAFCIQFGVQGALGVIPIHLAELSPPAFRATFPGVTYQLGTMVPSASAQIEATGADNLHTTIIENGVPTIVPDYATVQGIFIGVVAAFVILMTIIGPEHHGSHFEQHKAAFEDGGHVDDGIIIKEVTLASGGAEAPGDEEKAEEK